MNKRSWKGNVGRCRPRDSLHAEKDVFEVCEARNCEEDDANFVQAVVWLQSAAILAKDVSRGRFSMMLDERRSDRRHARNDSTQLENEASELCDPWKHIENRSETHQQRSVAEKPTLHRETSNSSLSSSSQNANELLQAQTAVENEVQVIPDSDEECASCSDLFGDSPALQEAQNTFEQSPESLSDIIAENTRKKCCFFSENSALSKQSFLETADPLMGALEEDGSSDITAFSEPCSLFRQNCDGFILEADSLQRDSAYDTYQLRTQHTAASESAMGNDFIEIQDSRSKRRRVESACKSAEPLGRRGTRWFGTTVEGLDANDVALHSVRVILSVLLDERTTKRYMKRRLWRDTLEEQAVNAILSFSDCLEAESKTAACTREIVGAIVNFVDESEGNTELGKVAISSHRISILSQLCSSIPVCVETINHLTTKLKSYENLLINTMSNKRANVHRLIYQLHAVFHALTICFRKYRSFPRSNSENQLENITPAVNLWKKQFLLEGAIVEDTGRVREERWCKILDDFTMVAMETNFLQFVERSRTLVNMFYIKTPN